MAQTSCLFYLLLTFVSSTVQYPDEGTYRFGVPIFHLALSFNRLMFCTYCVSIHTELLT